MPISKTMPRKPRPVSFPATLHRRNVYVLPTGHGILFIAVLFAMLLGSLNYNNNLGFLLTFLLGGMTFVSILYTVRNLTGLTVVSVRVRPVFAGETASFQFILQAEKPDRLAIRFAFPESPQIQQDLPGEIDAVVSLRQTAPVRGIFRPGPITISTRHPLGLFRAWSRLNLPVECLVYPRPLAGPLTLSNGPSVKGDEGDLHQGPGSEDFQGLRQYQPGDTLQHISWKTYSRGQGLFTKQFTAQQSAAIQIDWEQILEKDLETRLSRVCHNVLEAHNRRLTYGLRLPGVEIPADRGEAHKHECLRALARFGLVGEKHDR